jgi:Ca2+-binding RTX toxin-like protein
MRRHHVAAVTVFSILLIGWPSPAMSAVLEYPSSTCPTTLQDCIDGAPAGSTIRIVTDTPIAEIAVIDKTLRLEAGPGYDPVIEFGLFAHAPSPAPVRIRVRDLTFHSQVRARFVQGSGHLFVLRDSTISGDDFGGVSLDASGGSASFVVARNVIQAAGHQVDQIDLFTSEAFGSADFSIVGNRMTSGDYPESHAGIRASFYGTGTVDADIYSNLIRRVGGCFCGYAAAIGTDANQNVEATLNIVGNTIYRPRIGIGIRGASDASEFRVNLFNNIVARAVGTGLSVQEDPTGFSLRNGHNDFFANGQPNDWGDSEPGPATLHRRPRFVDPAAPNFRLLPISPLIDQGVVCSPGGTPRVDADRHDRIAGPSVDIGAYEFGSRRRPGPGVSLIGSNAPQTLTGGRGNDVLCGLGGKDTLLGRRGRDRLFGGRGADDLNGGDGADRLKGGLGSDVHLGRPGPDILVAVDGQAGNDVAKGGAGRDRCLTDPGDRRRSCELA